MADYSHLLLREANSKPEASFSFPRTPIPRPRNPEPDAVPTFFWPLVTVLLSISVALICWGAYNNLPQMASGGEKHLRPAHPSPKFNTTSAEAPDVQIPELLPEPELVELAVIANATGEPPLFQQPLVPPPLVPNPAPQPFAVEMPLVVPKVELPFGLAPVPSPPPPVPEPMLPAPPPTVEIHPAKLAPLQPPELPVQVAPTNPLVYRESTSGETPMLRNWKTLALCSLMTTTVFVQVPVPVAAGEKDNKELLQRIDTFQESVKKSFERLDTHQESVKKSFESVTADIGGIKADLQGQKGDLKKIRDDIDILKDDGLKQRLDLASANSKIKQIESALEKIRTDLDTLRNREPSAVQSGIDKASVEEIKAKLGAIEQAILKLQPPTSRIALSPPPSASPAGRVMLVNLYPEELLFLINQKSYRVAPGSNLPLENVPAGALNYEVISGTWGLRARSTTNLAPNETFTLTAR